jgi:hypothetical protein
MNEKEETMSINNDETGGCDWEESGNMPEGDSPSVPLPTSKNNQRHNNQGLTSLPQPDRLGGVEVTVADNDSATAEAGAAGTRQEEKGSTKPSKETTASRSLIVGAAKNSDILQEAKSLISYPPPLRAAVERNNDKSSDCSDILREAKSVVACPLPMRTTAREKDQSSPGMQGDAARQKLSVQEVEKSQPPSENTAADTDGTSSKEEARFTVGPTVQVVGEAADRLRGQFLS